MTGEGNVSMAPSPVASAPGELTMHLSRGNSNAKGSFLVTLQVLQHRRLQGRMDTSDVCVFATESRRGCAGAGATAAGGFYG